MVHTQYLVVGSSHAALEAVSAIRMHDPEGSLALVTRDSRLPYSPTVLPYVVSGRSAPENVLLRATDYFAGQQVELHGRSRAGAASAGAQRGDAVRRRRDQPTTNSCWRPVRRRPFRPFPASSRFPYHVLRTLDDALS